MTDGFALRRATPDDSDALLVLRDAVYPEYATEPPELRLEAQLGAHRDVPNRYATFEVTTSRIVG